ncbi:aldo/keto reductase [Terribacillus saccharophilus]|jgi:diketogulonate reductase-like aldo/keto reductase|uniref:2,5-diketo-D-gluconic acid reductase n=1 Tax=Terribacillus saccharophilus TaxID=361277 RepID=A0ABX4H1S0_9BACI|nr:aldo/keto reductase [Terribacillus saccharophilus]PAD36685.1 2,5-diketo-D-gluconic acid reductase [Terribacillus saccharophilus]PAD97667.1 2,5-diketo-D-gluconic acid reductase [Terribacillus saccharophilus]PAE01049.1 2,5-diketo-D-gluconic acid reductase [Terribacillus saccharophilus]
MYNDIPTKKLHDGTIIPAVGFGTYSLKGSQGFQAIRSAIDAGYRLLDTAYNYENEATVGQAIKQHGISREEILVTSKLPGRYHQHGNAITTIQESLYRAGLDYYDLYLIHWPNPKQDHYVEAWQALLEARKWGLIRSIGVCNFLPEHLERLKAETGELPVINQIELHPFFNQEKQRQYHEENGIVTESWSPLGRKTNLLEHPLLAEIAESHGRTVSQIVLRWHYQLGSIAIPKSATPSRQVENLAIFDFELNHVDMEKINSLTVSDGRIADQDPAVYEEF